MKAKICDFCGSIINENEEEKNVVYTLDTEYYGTTPYACLDVCTRCLNLLKDKLTINKIFDN